MSYNIDQVNAESSAGQIEEARRQALSEIDTIAKTEAIIQEKSRQVEGERVDRGRKQAGYEEDLRAENAATAEGDVAIEAATAGMPAGIEMAKTAGAVLTDRKQSDPAHLDNSKLDKMTGGMVKSANTFESMLKSFMGDENPKVALMERAEIQGGFTAANKDEAPKGMAVPPESANIQSVQLVQSLSVNLGQKAHYEATLANAAKAEQQLSARNNPSLGPGGMAGPSMTLANGPKGPSHLREEDIVGAA
ncbi:MAG: hypothetical protein AAF988_00030 [Pseudomonadota bacterium]